VAPQVPTQIFSLGHLLLELLCFKIFSFFLGYAAFVCHAPRLGRCWMMLTWFEGPRFIWRSEVPKALPARGVVFAGFPPDIMLIFLFQDYAWFFTDPFLFPEEKQKSPFFLDL